MSGILAKLNELETAWLETIRAMRSAGLDEDADDLVSASFEITAARKAVLEGIADTPSDTPNSLQCNPLRNQLLN
jgi:hypothetical protein